MYYFLGIVAQEDVKNGYITPSYILCQSHGGSAKRSGWRVVKQNEGNSMRSMSKVLVTSLTGHDDMIDFLCSYRTRDHMHGDKKYKHHQTKKYYPKGGLFWFECTRYGEPNGAALFIQSVPVKNKKTDSGFKRLLESRAQLPTLKDLLLNETGFEYNPYSSIKPKLVQRRNEDAGKRTSKHDRRVQSPQQD